MKALLLLLSLAATGAYAHDLPSNLLLKCEGKLAISTIPVTIIEPGKKFEATLRLKGGELSDINSPWLTTKNCALNNGVVYCSDQLVVSSGIGKGSERRELEAFLTRETGEFRFFLETWGYDGPNAKGKPTSNMKQSRIGLCRPISGPLF